ncbi:MarR family transcriptional regulator, partial [Cribrihabitans sp. XS_ASV171]
GVLGQDGIEEITTALRRVERYWTDQIRYIY